MSDERPIADLEAELLIFRLMLVEIVAYLSKQKENPEQSAKQFIARIVAHLDRLEARHPERAAVYEHGRMSLDRLHGVLNKHLREG